MSDESHKTNVLGKNKGGCFSQREKKEKKGDAQALPSSSRKKASSTQTPAAVETARANMSFCMVLCLVTFLVFLGSSFACSQVDKSAFLRSQPRILSSPSLADSRIKQGTLGRELFLIYSGALLHVSPVCMHPPGLGHFSHGWLSVAADPRRSPRKRSSTELSILSNLKGDPSLAPLEGTTCSSFCDLSLSRVHDSRHFLFRLLSNNFFASFSKTRNSTSYVERTREQESSMMAGLFFPP